VTPEEEIARALLRNEALQREVEELREALRVAVEANKRLALLYVHDQELLTRARGTIVIVLAQLDELTRVLDGRA
jgi:hypothetical protein